MPSTKLRVPHLVAGVVGTTALLAIVAVYLASPSAMLTRQVRRALQDSPDWEGSVQDIDLDVWGQTLSVRGLDVRATSPHKVLRRVVIPRADYRFSWREVVRGEIHLRGSGIGAEIVAARGVPKQDRNHPMPDPGFWRFQVDSAVVDGEWRWEDLDSGKAHSVVGVNGIYDGLGDLGGPGTLRVLGRVSDTGTVIGDGALDFFNAHRDAIDLRLEVRNFDAAALQGMDQVYLGTTMEGGHFDADVAFTLDKGRQELVPPYRTGEVPNLEAGKLTGHLHAVDLIWAGLPIEPVGAGMLDVRFEGTLDGSAPFEGKLAVEDLELGFRYSQFASLNQTRGTPPSEVMGALPPFVVSSAMLDRVRLTWIDDRHTPPIELSTSPLTITMLDVHNLPDRPESRVSLRGDVIEGALAVDGTVALNVWPPPTALEGSVEGASAAALMKVLEGYVTGATASGHLDVHGSLTIDAEGLVTPAGEVDGRKLKVLVADWGADLGTGRVDVFGGSATLTGLAIRNGSADSVFDQGTARSASVTWDADRLFDRKEVVASVTLEQPDLVFRRPVVDPAGSKGMERPDQGFRIDVAAHDGSLTWKDASEGTQISLAPFEAQITGLGTLTRRAHWVVSGDLERGGRLEGEADVDAFAGPGQGMDLEAHATLTGLILERFAPEAKAYAGIAGLRGNADLTLDRTPASTLLVANGSNLVLAHALGDLSCAQAQASVEWPSDGSAPTLSGNLHGVDAQLRIPSETGKGRAEPTSPVVRLDELRLRNSRLAVESEQGVFEVVGVDATARDLAWPPEPGHGRVDLTGRTLEGRVSAVVRPADRGHRLDVRGIGLDMPQANPWLLYLAGFDLAAGTGEVRAIVNRLPGGELSGEIRTRIDSIDVFQKEDWKRGFFPALKEAAIGLVLHAADRDDRLELVLPLDPKVDGPLVDATGSVWRALKARFALTARDDEAWDAFDQALAVETLLTPGDPSPPFLPVVSQ